jgi:ketosteroid isomerase-like protein
LITGCKTSDEKQIISLLEKRDKALINGNHQDYFSCLSTSYKDSFFPVSNATYVIKKILSSPDKPYIEFSLPEIYRSGSRAVVKEGFRMEGIISGRARVYDLTQHLRLHKTEEGWRIESGSKVYSLLAGRVDEEDKIEEVLKLREKALENKDIKLYMTVVSPKYLHRGQGIRELERKLKDNFLVFDEIQYETSKRKISFFGDYAMVKQEYRLEARLMGEAQVHSDKEMLELILDQGEWKIVKGL